MKIFTIEVDDQGSPKFETFAKNVKKSLKEAGDSTKATNKAMEDLSKNVKASFAGLEKSLTSNFKAMTGGMKSTADSLKTFGATVNSLVKENEKLKGSLDKTKEKLDIYKKGLIDAKSQIISLKGSLTSLTTEQNKLSAAFTKLSGANLKLKGDLDKTKSALQQLATFTKQLSQSYIQTASALTKANTQINALQQSSSKQKTQIQQLQAAVKLLTQQIGNLNKQFAAQLGVNQKLQNHLNAITAGYRRAGTGVGNFVRGHAGHMGYFTRTMATGTTAITRFTSAISGLRGFAGAALIGIGFRRITDEVREFDASIRQAFSFIGKKSVQEAFGQSAAGVRSDIYGLVGGGGNQREYSQSLQLAIGSGVRPDESIGFLSQATDLAVAGRGTIEETVDLLTTLRNAYGAEFKTPGGLEKGMAILFNVMDEGKVTLNQIGKHFSTVAGIAAELNIPLEQVGAAIGTLTQKGHLAPRAFVELNAMFDSLLKQAEQWYEKFGVDIVDVAKKGGLSAVLEEVNKQMEGNIHIMREFFPEIRAQRGLYALLRDEAATYKEVLAEIVDLESLRRAIALQKGGFDFTLDALGNKFSALFSRAGDTVLPKVLPQIGQIIESLTSAINGNQLIPLFERIGEVFSRTIQILIDRKHEIVAVIDLFVSLTEVVLRFVESIEGIIPALDKILLAIGTWKVGSTIASKLAGDTLVIKGAAVATGTATGQGFMNGFASIVTSPAFGIAAVIASAVGMALIYATQEYEKWARGRITSYVNEDQRRTAKDAGEISKRFGIPIDVAQNFATEEYVNQLLAGKSDAFYFPSSSDKSRNRQLASGGAENISRFLAGGADESVASFTKNGEKYIDVANNIISERQLREISAYLKFSNVSGGGSSVNTEYSRTPGAPNFIGPSMPPGYEGSGIREKMEAEAAAKAAIEAEKEAASEREASLKRIINLAEDGIADLNAQFVNDAVYKFVHPSKYPSDMPASEQRRKSVDYFTEIFGSQFSSLTNDAQEEFMKYEKQYNRKGADESMFRARELALTNVATGSQATVQYEHDIRELHKIAIDNGFVEKEQLSALWDILYTEDQQVDVLQKQLKGQTYGANISSTLLGSLSSVLTGGGSIGSLAGTFSGLLPDLYKNLQQNEFGSGGFSEVIRGFLGNGVTSTFVGPRPPLKSLFEDFFAQQIVPMISSAIPNLFGSGPGEKLISSLGSIGGSELFTKAFSGLGGAAGPLGALAGSFLGPILGGLKNLVFGPSNRERFSKFGGSYGVQLGEEDYQTVYQRSYKQSGVGNKGLEKKDFISLGLDLIIQKMEITKDNIAKVSSDFLKLFTDIAKGGDNSSIQVEVLNDSFAALIPKIEEAGLASSASFQTLIAAAKASGQEIKAVNEYLRKNLAEGAAGLSKFIQGIQIVSKEGIKIGKEKFTLGGAKFSEKDAGKLTKEQLESISQIAGSMFEALSSAGGASEALLALGDTTKELAKQFKELNIPIPEFLSHMIQIQNFTNANEGLFMMIEGMKELATNLDEAGALSGDTIKSLTMNLSDMFGSLQRGGMSELDALRELAPILQAIYNQHLRNGTAIDKETQALIDQAKGYDLITDAGTGMITTLQRGFDELLKALGHNPIFNPGKAIDAANKAGGAWTDAINKIKKQGGTLDDFWNDIKGGTDGGEKTTVPKFASGSMYIPNDMLAYVHKGEKIIPAHKDDDSGGGGSIDINVTGGTIGGETYVKVKDLKVQLQRLVNEGQIIIRRRYVV